MPYRKEALFQQLYLAALFWYAFGAATLKTDYRMEPEKNLHATFLPLCFCARKKWRSINL